MDKIFSKNIVGSISVLWIVFIFCLLVLKRDSLTGLELNAIGDFLAGTFAPLGFFWLVAGFYQQGKGLEQNSEALRLQAEELQKSTEALNLQVVELKSTAEGQNQLVKLANEEITQRHFQYEPNLIVQVTQFEINQVSIPIYDDFDEPVSEVDIDKGEFSLEIIVKSNIARRIQVIDIKKSNILKTAFESKVDDKLFILFEYYEEDLNDLYLGKKDTKNITIHYANILGKFYKKNYFIELKKDELSNKISVHLHPVIDFIHN